jgi:hypothetical protein
MATPRCWAIVTPAGPRQLHHLLDQAIQVHGTQGHLRLTVAIELAHAGHRLRDILDRALDGLELATRPRTQARLSLQQRFCIERHGRDRVIDIVGDATRHLPKGAQTLLLQDRLLRLAQVFIGLLQGTVELRLVGRQGDVRAHLFQEFAFAAAEAARLAARGNEYTKHFAFDQHRRGDHGAQAASGQPLR